MTTKAFEEIVYIPINSVKLEGALAIPENAEGIVLFAHGSGSSRLSPRNNFVAQVLRQSNLATLLIDLLTEQEDTVYRTRFDIDLLTKRLLAVTKWLQKEDETKDLPIGYFGASTGAAAALKAAATIGQIIKAVVSRGGRPDLAESSLMEVQSPTLLIVGGNDDVVLDLNRQALEDIKTTKELKVVQGATHLFEESGTLEEVAKLANDWFKQYLHKEKH